MGLIRVGQVDADISRTVTVPERENLIAVIANAFEANRHRHPDIKIRDVIEHMRKSAGLKSLWSLDIMERAGGIVDVTGFNPENGRYRFDTMVQQGPKGFTDMVYDRKAKKINDEMYSKDDDKVVDVLSRVNTAVGVASELGAELWTKEYLLERDALESTNSRDKKVKRRLMDFQNFRPWLRRDCAYFYGGMRTWLHTPAELLKTDEAFYQEGHNGNIYSIGTSVHDTDHTARYTLWV